MADRVRLKPKPKLTPKCESTIAWLREQHANLPSHAEVYVVVGPETRNLTIIDLLFTQLSKSPHDVQALYIKLVLSGLLRDNVEYQKHFARDILRHQVLIETPRTEASRAHRRRLR